MISLYLQQIEEPQAKKLLRKKKSTTGCQMRRKVYVAEFCNTKITKVDTLSDFFIQDKVRQTNTDTNF